MMKKSTLLLKLVMCVALLSAISIPVSAETVVRIAHWMGDPGYGGTPVTNLMEAVNAKVAPLGIKVETVISQVDGYRDKVLAQVLGGIGPDIIMELPNQYALQSAGIFRDLTPYLSRDKEVNFNSFLPAVWGMYTYWGGTWLVPAGVSPYLLFYNPKYFQQAGLAIPNASWSWAKEVDQAIRKLRTVDPNTNTTQFYGLLLENRPWTLVFSNGGDIIGPDGTKAVLNSPAVVGITELVQGWRKEDLIPVQSGNYRPAFAQEKGAMHGVMGTFAFGFFASQPFEWSFTYVPDGAAGKSIDENTIGWGINKYSSNPDAAWEVLKAIVSVQGTIVMEVYNHFSPMKGKTDVETVRYMQQSFNLSKDEIDIALDSVNYVRPTLRHIKGAEITSIANSAIGNVIWQGRPPGPTLQDATDRINAILADEN
jgi:sn-glycerol 3-phosphate transport system substrate-binding protein